MKISMCNEMSSDYRSSSNERSNSASPSAAAAVTSRNVGEDFPGEEGGPSSRNLAPSITVAPATPGIPAGSNLEDQLGALDEKLKRTSKFLHEIKKLSGTVEEQKDDSVNEREVFMRRILQVSAELRDARDLFHAVVRPPRLSARQFDLVVHDPELDPESDPSLDPSVRFFGLDWQQIFARCFSLSINFRIFRAQAEVGPDSPVDLVLLSSMLKDISRVEADVVSHGEAVLNGRLSKSQQRLIQEEQNRLSCLALNDSPSGGSPNKARNKVGKSKSFRDTTGQKKATGGHQRSMSRYKKTRTTNLDRLTMDLSTASSASASGRNSCAGSAANSSTTLNIAAAAADTSSEWREAVAKSEAKRNNSSFIRKTVNTIFKNIR